MLPRRCDLLIAIALWASRPPAGIDALVPIANPAADEPPMRREQRDRQREQQQEQPGRRQQRRVRYAGRYPRRFEDRHKELGGDADTMSRVLLKGGTPAGSHVPIMPAECLSRLGLLLPTATTTAEEEDHHPPLVVDDAGNAGSGRPLVVVDCTLGYGGHSRLILEALSRWTTDHDEYDDDDGLSSRRRSAVLVSFDKDSVELAKAEARLRARWDTTTLSAAGDNGVNDDGSGSTEQQPQAAATAAPPRVRLDCVHASFANVADELSRLRLPRASALLADLGCSSMQVDDPSRGFTWKADGPLDMRMDAAAAAAPDDDDDARTTKTTPSSDHTMTRGTITAADLLAKLNTTTLAAILRDNSDFVRSDARRLAIAILADPIPTTTSELDARVRGVTPPPPETMTTTSTAVRGGRAVVVGGGGGGGSGRRPSTAWDAAAEERREILSSRVARVMQALRIEVNGEFGALDSLLGDLPRILAPGGRAVFLTFHSGEDRRVKLAMKDGMRAGHYSEVSRRVIRAGPEEVRANPRSRCSKLRWCVRSAAAT